MNVIHMPVHIDVRDKNRLSLVSDMSEEIGIPLFEISSNIMHWIIIKKCNKQRKLISKIKSEPQGFRPTLTVTYVPGVLCYLPARSVPNK